MCLITRWSGEKKKHFNFNSKWGLWLECCFFLFGLICSGVQSAPGGPLVVCPEPAAYRQECSCTLPETLISGGRVFWFSPKLQNAKKPRNQEFTFGSFWKSAHLKPALETKFDVVIENTPLYFETHQCNIHKHALKKMGVFLLQPRVWWTYLIKSNLTSGLIRWALKCFVLIQLIHWVCDYIVKKNRL